MIPSLAFATMMALTFRIAKVMHHCSDCMCLVTVSERPAQGEQEGKKKDSKAS